MELEWASYDRQLCSHVTAKERVEEISGYVGGMKKAFFFFNMVWKNNSIFHDDGNALMEETNANAKDIMEILWSNFLEK